MSRVQSQLIPQFALYGESNLSQQPSLVHIEDIVDRSRDHDWLIKPHRHTRLFQILLLINGGLQVKLEDQQYQLQGNWAVSIPPGCVHGFEFPADTQGIVLSVKASLLNSQTQQFQGLASLVEHAHTVSFLEQDVLFAQFKNYLDLIRQELKQPYTGHEAILSWLIGTLLMTLWRQLQYSNAQMHHNPKSSQIFQQFRQAVEQHYREQWDVQAYAKALHMSVSSLNRLCQEKAGNSAKALIQERVLLEAKRRLIYTQESLERVAESLGFKDPAYFSRFFKNLAGVPPSDYRKAKYLEMGTS
ncbi:helix-turn-helix domain-containing protein [uncultured Thiothrix sp.]|uniref:helix-turn-helix domain-containing protein n=1 Tax=uncultured Thiothrix sp. TaxID=223185 RepID=UPI002629D64A|nr:helix-turn-helix domain-containing protein [uncultured Thiothrix sp.]